MWEGSYTGRGKKEERESSLEYQVNTFEKKSHIFEFLKSSMIMEGIITL